MKSHERIRAEAKLEDRLLEILEDKDVVDENQVYRSPQGDFLIEVKAHYLGSKSKRLREPLDGD